MKDGPSPVLILIILFVIIGFAYSPIKNRPRQNTGQSTTSAIGGSSSTTYNQNKSTAETVKEAEEEVARLEQNLNKQIEESTRSPFYRKVSMSGISGTYQDDPNLEYMSLYTNLEKDEALNITGWYLKSEVTGYYATIGKAALLPFPFTNTESDVILQQYDRVYIVKGFSPIGISFRTNLCTGYFEENRTFIPNLPLDCPYPKDEDLPRFSEVHDRNDECLDIIERLSRCTTVSGQYLRDLPDTVPQSCKNYLSTQINYNSCVAKNFGNTNFPGNEYRIYLNKFGPLWRERREKINLHDRSGLIVDTISY